MADDSALRASNQQVMAGDSLPPDLRANSVDFTAAAARAVLSLVPVGGVISELISVLLPKQREERLARYVYALQEELERLRVHTAVEAHRFSCEQVSLFEAGARASGEATTSDRVDRLAKIAAGGMAGDDLAAARAKRLIKLLEDVSNDDAIFLSSFTSPYSDDEEWRERHRHVLYTQAYATELRDKRTPQEEIRSIGAHVDLQFYRLQSMGLIEQRDTYALPDDLPERLEDRSTWIYSRRSKAQLVRDLEDPRLSDLGRLVLESLGLLKPPPIASSSKEWDAIEASDEPD
jgi:hypothetical protein